MHPLAERLTSHEKLFTKIVLKKGMIDRVRLDECVERHAGDGGTHIGLALRQEGLLDADALMRVCRSMQKYVDRAEHLEEFQREDELVQRLVVESGLVRGDVAEECRVLQRRMAEKEVPSAYGWILIQKGLIAPEDYLALLKFDGDGDGAADEKVVATCEKCGSSFRVRPKARKGKFNCPNCQSVIVVESAAPDRPLATEDRALQATRHLARMTPEGDDEDAKATIDTAEARSLGGSSTAPPMEGGPFDKEDFAGDYRIENEIARGGMGIVFKARQKSLDRIVALKILKEGERASKASVKRFVREAQAAGKLDHQNIVAIHEVSEYRGIPYFTMAYIEGDSLDNLIRKKRLSLRRGVEILEQTARGVHYAHGGGIVHRDIKPANILVDVDGIPKITDFGLAKCVDFKGRLTQSGYAIGTPYYMSPEQARGDLDRIGPRSDVYNLGVILYEMLAGRVPFLGRSNVEIYEKIRHEEPRPPRDYNATTPKDLQNICLKAMEKDPGKRYRSAKEFAEDLRRYLDGELVQARPVGLGTKVYKKIKKNKTTSAVAGLAGVIISALTLVILSLYLRQEGASVERAQVAETLVASGEEALARFDPSSAFDLFDQALRSDSANARALLGRGKSNYYLRNFRNADLDLRRAIELDPGAPEPHFHLGATLLRMGQPATAIEALSRAADLSTGEDGPMLAARARIHYYRGSAYVRSKNMPFALKDFDLAIEEYREALAAGVDPNAPWPQRRDRSYFLALLGRGIVRLTTGDVDAALACFDEAIAIRGRNVEAHVLKALALWRGGFYESAVDVLVRIEYIRPGEPETWSDAVDEILDGGLVLDRSVTKALEPSGVSDLVDAFDFSRIQGRDSPDPSSAFHQDFSRFLCKYERGEYELLISNLNSMRLMFGLMRMGRTFGPLMQMQPEAARIFEQVDQIYKKAFPRIIGYTALAHIGLGDAERARNVLENRNMLEMGVEKVGEESEPLIHAVRGMVEHRRGEYRTAIQSYEKAMKIDPSWVRLHVLAGKSYLDLHLKEGGKGTERLEAAQREFARAFDADPDRYEAAYYLGAGARRRGDEAGMIQWWTKARQIEPRLLELQKRLDELNSSKEG